MGTLIEIILILIAAVSTIICCTMMYKLEKDCFRQKKYSELNKEE